MIRAEPDRPLKVFGEPTAERRICRMIFDELCVLANGDIVCSCGDPAGKLVYGNVFRDRIAPVFDGKTYRAMRSWQLRTEATSWCPVIRQRCGGRISSPEAGDRPEGRTVRMLQLEPISHCNLACPACPVTQFDADPSYRDDRAAILPLATMLDVVDQLPDLEKILFSNFGEPFLHPDAIEFLQTVRRQRPEIVLHTSTNGLALTPERIERIAAGALLDRIVFSIDGATEESYRRYRVGGHLARALGNLEGLAEATRRQGTFERIEIVWQYILFEWNDSPAEIAAARARAEEIGVPLCFVMTHTAGASRRLVEGAPELRDLLGVEDPWSTLTCDLRVARRDREVAASTGRYAAGLAAGSERIEIAPGERFAFGLRVENRSGSSWRSGTGPALEDDFRIGVQLLSRRRQLLRELRSIPLPAASREPGGATDLVVDGLAPCEPGRYELLIDVVEDGTTWFHERGSAPARVQLDVVQDSPPRSGPAFEPAAIVADLAQALLDRVATAAEATEWAKWIAEGTPVGTLATWIAAASGEDRLGERLDRAHAAMAARLGLLLPGVG